MPAKELGEAVARLPQRRQCDLAQTGGGTGSTCARSVYPGGGPCRAIPGNSGARNPCSCGSGSFHARAGQARCLRTGRCTGSCETCRGGFTTRGAPISSRRNGNAARSATAAAAAPPANLPPRAELMIARSCALERRTVCDLPAGGGRILACLAANESKLTPRCKLALEEVRSLR